MSLWSAAAMPPLPDDEERRRGGRIPYLFVVIAVAAVALLQSWQRWLDPIIDTGRDLYIPGQLAHGAKLYRDIRYQYPPFAPYLLTLIGRSLTAYTLFGIGQAAVVAGALWSALRRNTIAAFVATFFFVSLSLAGASTWGANFIFPYTYAATIGMALLMIALAALLEEQIVVAFAALLLASWCKVEYAIAVAMIVAAVAFTRRTTWRRIAAFVAAWVASFALLAVAFRDTHWLSEDIFARSLTRGETARRFFAVVAGTSNWVAHSIEIVVALAAIVAIVLLLRLDRPVATVCAVALSLVIANHSFFRAWALLQVIALVYALVRDRRSPLVLFAVFSFATTLRVPANVSPIWYGFVLIVPVYALVAYVLFVDLPERGVYRQRLALAWLPMVIVICALDLIEQHDRWAIKQFPIVSSRGTFFDGNPDRARILSRFIAGRPEGTLVVLPEGLTINYLTGTTTPLTFHTFTPVETADPAIEEQILGEIERKPPDRIAIVTRDVREYGYRGFGIDYDQRLVAWMRGRYRVEADWRAARFELLLLRRDIAAVSGSHSVSSSLPAPRSPSASQAARTSGSPGASRRASSYLPR